jgi:hypothetical protein
VDSNEGALSARWEIGRIALDNLPNNKCLISDVNVSQGQPFLATVELASNQSDGDPAGAGAGESNLRG